MAGFTSYDQIINAITVNGKGERITFQKNSITTVAGGKHCFSYAAGIPAAQTFGTALTATAVTAATNGAMPFTNATSPATKHMLTCGLATTAAAGTFMIYDLLARYPFNGTTTSGTFTSVTLPARDINGTTNGAGVMAMVVNANSTTTAAVNLTLTYTNSGGTTARSTGATAMVASIQHRVVHDTSGFFMPLAAGDVGIRTIQSYTLSATATSTQLEVQLVRPLAFLPVLLAGSYTERSLVTETPALPIMYDGTAIHIALMASTTSSGNIVGNLQYAEN